jgi:hypothetical protein
MISFDEYFVNYINELIRNIDDVIGFDSNEIEYVKYKELLEEVKQKYVAFPNYGVLGEINDNKLREY